MRGLLVVALGSFLVVGTGVREAAAHTGLESSVPADGEVLTDVPGMPGVTLTFTEDVQAEFAQVAVTGPDGESVTSGAVVVEGAVARQPVDLSAEGAYVVAYRVVSSDGHPVSGQLAFSVQDVGDTPAGTTAEVPPSTASPEPTASPSAVTPAADGDNGSGSGGWWPVFAVGGALVAVCLGALELIRRRRTDG